MRRIRYIVAMSLDGYIAGPKGEFDWIIADPEVDFAGTFSQFDTFLIGRRTFEFMVQAGRAAMPGMKVFVFSRTLHQTDYPDVTIVSERPGETLKSLRENTGKDIWLFGGGSLFQSLLQTGFVDTVEVSIVPILLGNHVYKTGVISLQYAVA
jgi:dihydrofolate reductase